MQSEVKSEDAVSVGYDWLTITFPKHFSHISATGSGSVFGVLQRYFDTPPVEDEQRSGGYDNCIRCPLGNWDVHIDRAGRSKLELKGEGTTSLGLDDFVGMCRDLDSLLVDYRIRRLDARVNFRGFLARDSFDHVRASFRAGEYRWKSIHEEKTEDLLGREGVSLYLGRNRRKKGQKNFKLPELMANLYDKGVEDNNLDVEPLEDLRFESRYRRDRGLSAFESMLQGDDIVGTCASLALRPFRAGRVVKREFVPADWWVRLSELAGAGSASAPCKQRDLSVETYLAYLIRDVVPRLSLVGRDQSVSVGKVIDSLISGSMIGDVNPKLNDPLTAALRRMVRDSLETEGWA